MGLNAYGKAALCAALLFINCGGQAQASLADLLVGDKFEQLVSDFMNRLDTLSEKRVREVLEGVDKTASESIATGIAGGQLLMIQGGNQLKVATQSAAILLGNQLDDTVGDLDQSMKELLAGILVLTRAVEDGADKIIDFADLTALDVEILAGRVTGIEKAPLHLRGFRNTIFPKMPEGSKRSIEIRGPYFGSDTADMKTTYSFSINGRDLGEGRMASGVNSKHNRLIEIPSQLINDLVDESRMTTETVDAYISRDHTRSCRLFWSCTETEEISLKLPITVLPREVGYLEAVIEKPVYGFVKLEDPRETTVPVRASAPISLSLSNVNPGGPMNVGHQKFDRDSVKASCATDVRSFRRFHQHQGGYQEFSASHPYFQNGYTATNVGPGRASKDGNVDGPGTLQDISARTIARMKDIFGAAALEPNTRLYNLIVEKLRTRIWGQHKVRETDWPKTYAMTFTAAELNEASSPYSRDISGCGQQSAAPASFENDGELRLVISSSTTVAGNWTVSADVLEWRQTGRETERKQIPVFIEDIAEIEVTDAARSNLNLTFHSGIFGQEHSFTLDTAPAGFRKLETGKVGEDTTVYKLLYRLQD